MFEYGNREMKCGVSEGEQRGERDGSSGSRREMPKLILS